jgi:hypothetical protein
LSSLLQIKHVRVGYSTLGFNGRVDLTECHTRCRASRTDAAVAALLPRNVVEAWPRFVSARRLTSGRQFLFQNCNALFQVLHRTDTDCLV